jgi:hypothetical protein
MFDINEGSETPAADDVVVAPVEAEVAADAVATEEVAAA